MPAKSESKKKNESKSEEEEDKKDGVRQITVSGFPFTIPEPLPLKKPDEREWDPVGMHMSE